MRRAVLLLGLEVVCLMLSRAPARAVVPSRTELAAARRWCETAVLGSRPPFSFTCGGQPAAPARWPVERSSRSLDPQRVEHTAVYTDPSTGLQARLVVVVYRDFPTVEWTVYLKNPAHSDSPLIEHLQGLDVPLSTGGTVTLHHPRGTTVARNDYEPQATELATGADLTITPGEGRPCQGEFPYFNLQYGGGGRILAVGWPGKWAARFARDGSSVHLAAGQELTRFTLHPGEEVRTPLIAVQLYRGEPLRGQNIWRRWMLAHNLPRRGGKLPPPQLPAVSGNHYPGLLCNQPDEILFIDKLLAERIPITHWWMDAGWYKNQGDWTSVGTWEVDRQRFPGGVRAVADHAHAKGLKLILWFEPERVAPGSWLATNHPEWVLPGPAGLLDLGNPAAWQWLVDRLDKIITDEGVDFYRQDFNMDPLPCWRDHDAPDRQGITEIKHVMGYLALWDELVRRHPALMIDSCASGGHRNDLETMRRAVPLLRSDQIFDPIGEQCHTYGFAQWLPYWGTGFIDFDPYIFRGCLGLDTTIGVDARRPDIDWALLRRLCRQWQRLAPNFTGDFYPLTPYTLADDAWIAWQFDRPEEGRGMVQAFRRKDSPYETARLRLQGLDPAARYVVEDVDGGKGRTLTGQELLAGLAVTVKGRPGAVVLTYRRE